MEVQISREKCRKISYRCWEMASKGLREFGEEVEGMECVRNRRRIVEQYAKLLESFGEGGKLVGKILESLEGNDSSIKHVFELIRGDLIKQRDNMLDLYEIFREFVDFYRNSGFDLKELGSCYFVKR